MEQSAVSHKREITLDSNWITTSGMALLFALTAFVLGWSIRDLLFNKIDLRLSQHGPNAWLDTLTYVFGAVYCFLFAYRFPARHLRIAFVLLGMKYSVLLAIFHFHAGADVRRFVAMILEPIANQVLH